MSGRAPSVAIIGAGFGGVAAAIRAREAGAGEITILDAAANVGGVWEANTYPGCACDVPSDLYSFSFAPNPNWTRRFSPQPEIRDYLDEVVDRHGLRESLRLGTEVKSATWDEGPGRWRLDLVDGEQLEAEVLVTGCGHLRVPKTPSLEGIEDFAGPVFHSSQWRHDVDLRGLRVGVVGTGASAIQFVPQIAPRAGRLTVFQRSAPWTLPKFDGPYGLRERSLRARFPQIQRASRAANGWLMEQLAPVFTRRPPETARRVSALVRAMSALQRRVQLRGRPDLQRATRPDYELGCKRVLLTSEWFPTLRRPNVELVTAEIGEVTPEGILTADGRRHELDVIIFGTGFATSEMLAPLEVVGRDGETLRERWDDGAEAYLGLSVPGFPNMFIVYGPNPGHGTGSAVDVLEAQAEHIASGLRMLCAGQAERLEVRQPVFDAFRDEIAVRMQGTVWASGCGSWYVNENGRVTITWPGPPAEYVRRARRLSASDYHTGAASPVSAGT